MNNTIETYKIFSDFYDLYVGEFRDDLGFYKSFCKPGNKIIEVGCGTGRILEFLLHKNCKVTGVDISQDMLKKASVKLKRWLASGDLSLINHNFSFGRISDLFNVAIVTFYTYNYILKDQVAFLTNINESLDENGLLLMDLFYPNTLYDNSIDGKWIDKQLIINGLEINICDNRTMIDDIEHRQQIFKTCGSEIKIDSQRKYFSPKILKELLISSGFKNVEFSCGYNTNGFASMIDELSLRNNFIVKAYKG